MKSQCIMFFICVMNLCILYQQGRQEGKGREREEEGVWGTKFT